MQIQATLFLSKPVNVFNVSRETVPQYRLDYSNSTCRQLTVMRTDSLVMAMRVRRLLLADEKVNNRKWRDVDVKVWDNHDKRYIVS